MKDILIILGFYLCIGLPICAGIALLLDALDAEFDAGWED